MAHDFTAFYERLLGASGEYNQATVGSLNILDAVNLDVRPEIARIGQTIRIPFPDIGAFADRGLTSWTTGLSEVAPNYVDVVISTRPGKGMVLHDFEQYQTSRDIIKDFLDPLWKRASEFANGMIAAEITSANFNQIPVISGTVGKLAVEDATLAWDALVENKVPIKDASDASLIYHNNLHSNMLTDSAWQQESLVGASIASDTRRNAAAGEASQAFNFMRRWDQQAPTGVTANLTGTITVTQNSAAVTGSGTQFMLEAPVGSYIRLSGGTQLYKVKAVASATALTLAQEYAGTTAATQTFVRRTYVSLACHKYAIGVAARPLALVNNGQTQSRLLMLKGIPVRLQSSYEHTLGGNLVTMDFAMAVKVLRPNFGVVIKS